jgi:hypothetical protein
LGHIQTFGFCAVMGERPWFLIVVTHVLIVPQPDCPAIAVQEIAILALTLVRVFHDGLLHLAFAIFVGLRGPPFPLCRRLGHALASFDRFALL